MPHFFVDDSVVGGGDDGRILLQQGLIRIRHGAVQLEMLEDSWTRHPYYWASFVPIGAWGALSRPAGTASPDPNGGRIGLPHRGSATTPPRRM